MSSGESAESFPRFIVRRPRAGDGASVHRLVDRCSPLDLNSTYAYLLVCEHFAATSAAAERNGSVEGFVSGYLKPADSRVLFIWQVAVAPEARGHGLGKTMIREILARRDSRDVDYIETTISPSNKPSRAMFESLARQFGAETRDLPCFSASDFGGEAHEEERLLRIGPLDRGLGSTS